MKTLASIVILILLLPVISFSQENSFSLPVEVTQGFVFKDYQNPQWYKASVSISPTYNILEGRVHLSAIEMAVFSDGLTDYYIGTGASYTFLKKEKYSMGVMASALMGTRQSQLYGGGFKFTYQDIFVTVNTQQEYSKKELYFGGGLGINLWSK